MTGLVNNGSLAHVALPSWKLLLTSHLRPVYRKVMDLTFLLLGLSFSQTAGPVKQSSSDFQGQLRPARNVSSNTRSISLSGWPRIISSSDWTEAISKDPRMKRERSIILDCNQSLLD
jgi:hypothetical protein